LAPATKAFAIAISCQGSAQKIGNQLFSRVAPGEQIRQCMQFSPHRQPESRTLYSAAVRALESILPPSSSSSLKSHLEARP